MFCCRLSFYVSLPEYIFLFSLIENKIIEMENCGSQMTTRTVEYLCSHNQSPAIYFVLNRPEVGTVYLYVEMQSLSKD